MNFLRFPIELVNMNLTQLEQVKSELKRRFYDQNKFSGKTVNSIIFYLWLEELRPAMVEPRRRKAR
jgi:hypothetical protein